MMDKKERERIVKSCHTVPTSGHLGTRKTLAQVTEWFMWPGMTKEVYAMVGIYTMYSDTVDPRLYPDSFGHREYPSVRITGFVLMSETVAYAQQACRGAWSFCVLQVVFALSNVS